MGCPPWPYSTSLLTAMVLQGRTILLQLLARLRKFLVSCFHLSLCEPKLLKHSAELLAAMDVRGRAITRSNPVRKKGHYIPGTAVINVRHECLREPLWCKPFGCYFCGTDFDSKRDLVTHWRSVHLDLPEAIMAEVSDHQVEETMRSRFLCMFTTSFLANHSLKN